MPEPQADPNLPFVKRAAAWALGAGVVIALLKFSVFLLTNSVAVLSDALESLINIAAAAMVLYTIHYSNQPADREHPYGHGKIEFLAVGLEGWLILLAGVVIGYEAIKRLFFSAPELKLGFGLWFLGGVGILMAILGGYIWWKGRKYHNAPLLADGKHLLTDVVSTAGVLGGLVLARWTGWDWLDPIVAIIMASLILAASWRLLWQSFHGLMDSTDPEDERAIVKILDDEVTRGHIHGYHKVRHRHTGPFHWVDMHLQVDGDMSITQGHDLASRIEGRIEQCLGRANATAHLEPYDPERHPPAGLSSDSLFANVQASSSSSPASSPAGSTDAGSTDEGKGGDGAAADEAPSENGEQAPPAASDRDAATPSDSEEMDRQSAPPPSSVDRPELADERDPDDDDQRPS